MRSRPPASKDLSVGTSTKENNSIWWKYYTMERQVSQHTVVLFEKWFLLIDSVRCIERATLEEWAPKNDLWTPSSPLTERARCLDTETHHKTTLPIDFIPILFLFLVSQEISYHKTSMKYLRFPSLVTVFWKDWEFFIDLPGFLYALDRSNWKESLTFFCTACSLPDQSFDVLRWLAKGKKFVHSNSSKAIIPGNWPGVPYSTKLHYTSLQRSPSQKVWWARVVLQLPALSANRVKWAERGKEIAGSSYLEFYYP